MRVWICSDFEGFWPVGTASIVMAESSEQARALLQAALKERGLPESEFTLIEVDLTTPHAIILRDGNY